MDFDFSEDQESLREAVRRWVEKGYGFERRRGIVEAGGFDRAAYGELAELGLTGLVVQDAHGGLAMGPVEALIVMEELGRGLVLEPLEQTLIASRLLQDHAPDAVRDAWLPAVAAGEKIVVLAWQERAARYDGTRCAATATPDGDGWRIDGRKHLVPAGDRADALLVPATIDGTLALFLVEREAAGATTQGYGTQDGSRAADLTLAGAPAVLLTREGRDALGLAMDIGVVATCAQAVGVMDRTLAVTVEYMNTRKQFGVAIATFQALRHRVADMKMQLELARSMAYYAALKLDAPADDRRRAMARAKVQLGQSMRFVGQQAVQLHGGIGVTDEYIVSHYFRRLTQLEMTFGDTLHHLGQVSEQMQETAGVFA